MSSTTVAVAPTPLPRYRFVALGVVWCAYLVVFLSRLCVGPLAPFLKESFTLSNAQIGGLTSATAVSYAPTLIMAGWLADRIGVRRALLIGSAITGVCIGAVALAPSYRVMLLLLACSGFGCGFIYPTAVKAIMVWFPAHERATAVGVNQAAVNVSGMLGAAIMPALAAAAGWQAGFVFAALLAFAVCGLAAALYRDPVPGGGQASPPGTSGPAGAHPAVSAPAVSAPPIAAPP
ncbi:MAG: MFS transporter, partial [Thermoleophilia bacterium]